MGTDERGPVGSVDMCAKVRKARSDPMSLRVGMSYETVDRHCAVT